jgi:membrane associated rhomboid family serine protease
VNSPRTFGKPRKAAEGRTVSSLSVFVPKIAFVAEVTCSSPSGGLFRRPSGAILTEQSEPNPSEPIFNIPAAVLTTVAVLVLVHAVRVLLLSERQDIEFVLTFGFIPARFGSEAAFGAPLPGGFAADLWTFFTYAFIHADLTHLGLNLAWLIPFASALARRFGAWRYTLFMLTTAAIGAMAHLVTHLGAVEPMIGASAAISGAMAASMRFVFQRSGRIGFFRGPGGISHLPARPLGATLRDPRFLLFVAVWLGLNALVGSGTISFGAETGQEIAWQAHVGGFFAGLFLFKAFDPARPPPEFTAEPSI